MTVELFYYFFFFLLQRFSDDDRPVGATRRRRKTNSPIKRLKFQYRRRCCLYSSVAIWSFPCDYRATEIRHADADRRNFPIKIIRRTRPANGNRTLLARRSRRTRKIVPWHRATSRDFNPGLGSENAGASSCLGPRTVRIEGELAGGYEERPFVAEESWKYSLLYDDSNNNNKYNTTWTKTPKTTLVADAVWPGRRRV